MTGRLEAAIPAAIRSAPDRKVPTLRTLRHRFSGDLADVGGRDVVDLALVLMRRECVPRWFLYELVHHHAAAMEALRLRDLERLGEGLSSWGEVDPFALYLTGPAWRDGRIADAAVHAWSASPDLWWRRVAVVSTVPLNTPARGGSGDPDRTLAVCERLCGDREDMVVKAMSWALRALAARDPEAVRRFLSLHGRDLAARVRREVRNKLETGRKDGKAAEGGR